MPWRLFARRYNISVRSNNGEVEAPLQSYMYNCRLLSLLLAEKKEPVSGTHALDTQSVFSSFPSSLAVVSFWRPEERHPTDISVVAMVAHVVRGCRMSRPQLNSVKDMWIANRGELTGELWIVVNALSSAFPVLSYEMSERKRSHYESLLKQASTADFVDQESLYNPYSPTILLFLR